MLKCKNYLYFALFALSALFVGSFIIPTPNANASPLSYTVDSSNYGNEYSLCDSLALCSGYKYLSFVFNSNSYDFSTNFSVTVQALTSSWTTRQYRCSFTSKCFYYLPYDDYRSVGYSSSINVQSFFSDGGTITITLYDSDPMQGINPSGTLDVTENGTFDVTNYASVSVDVPETECPTCPSGGSNNYHDDLVNIQKSIIICGAILLVLYFFYCIYRLIIRNSGVH